MNRHIAFVLGTRPEIIKLAPVIRACDAESVPYTIIHTGQHYSDELDSVFFDQLELPEPDVNLGVGSSSHGRQTGEMLIGLEEAIEQADPTTVLVQGDTNSVLAGALATSKMDVALGHVEAGLRSNDREMPEETNRVVADHVSDHLFAPTEASRQNLRTEGLPDERIVVTGNTVVDAVQRNAEIARDRSDILAELDLSNTRYFLMTAHRAENVDDERRFRTMLDGVARAARTHDAEVIYPIHPRAADRLAAFDVDVPDRIRTVDPLMYLDFLRLEEAATAILTDSGGVQEEACILGVPCVTMRDTTERPETVHVRANTLSAPDDPEAIHKSVGEMLARDPSWRNPFGDGDAGERILAELLADLEVVAR